MKDTITKSNNKEPSEHPWKIIYKYFAILAIRRNDFEAREQFKMMQTNCLRYRGGIIIALERFGDAEVADEAWDVIRGNQLTEQLAGYLKGTFEVFVNETFSSGGFKRFSEMKKYFTFMYR